MKFDHIIADPNWHYNQRLNEGFGGTRTKFGNGAEGHYNLSGLDEICSMPVPEIMADDCFVHLWTTGPHFFDAGPVLEAWGCTPITLEFVWVKLTKGFLEEVRSKPLFVADLIQRRNLHDLLVRGIHKRPGHYTASNAELVVLGKKGKPSLPEVKMFPQVFFTVPGDHSEKPDNVHEYVEAAYPGQRYAELYARRMRPGWVTLGNEVPGQDGIDMRDSIPYIGRAKEPRISELLELLDERI